MSTLYALDPVFIGCVYAIVAVIFATIIGAGAAVLVIEAVADMKADRRFRQRQLNRIRLPEPLVYPMAVAA